jgi:hypothetical protein
MGKTPKPHKTLPKKKASQGLENLRKSPRGHKSSSGEIEVNARKRGSGPVGRGGKMIARRSQSPSSYESSKSSDSSESESKAESEAESEEVEEEEEGRLTTRNELLDQLREKERTIKKLQAEVDLSRKKSRPNKT